MKRSVVWLLLIAMLCPLLYCGAGPFLTIHGLQRALATRDTRQLDRYIDYPALRTHLKAQVAAQISQDPTGSSPLTQARAFLDGALAQLADVGVDLIMTPLGLAALLQGQAVINRARGITEGQDTYAPPMSSHLLDHPRYRMSSFSCVTATVYTASGQPLQLVMTRHGFHWKLTNILLPVSQSRPHDAP